MKTLRIPQLLKVVPGQAIEFGRNDGKFDSIEKYFLDTGLVEKVERGEKAIIIGRKGTGKTALAYHLKKQSELAFNKFVRVLSFKEVPIALMEQFSDNEHKHSNKFILLWRYIFLIEIAKLIVADESILDSDKDKLTHFLGLNFPTLKSSPREYLKETIERKFKVAFQLVEGEMSSKLEEGVVNLLGFTNNLQDLVRRIARIGNQYLVVIDELDDTYDNSDEYYSILTGMFKAGMELNHYFSEEHKACRIIMMLRSDIYNNVAYADKNKWSDMTFYINWLPNPTYSLFQSDLFKLINLRIGASLVDQPILDENYWSVVFSSEPVISELRPFQYILSRSYYRPRDIIEFCKQIQEAAKKNGSVKAFSKQDITDAELGYSNWFKNEIEDELRVKIPFIQDIFEAIKRHGQPTFTANNINAHFQRFHIVQKLSLYSALELMFEASVIGIFLEDNTDTPVFKFRDPNIDFVENRTYSIHYGLRPALKCGGIYKRKQSFRRYRR